MRIRKPVLGIGAVASLVLSWTGLMAPGASAAPLATDKAGTIHFTTAPANATSRGGIKAFAESGTITAGNCKYKQAVDDPHVTAGDASVHGSWLYVSGSCASTADIDVYLQAYGCSSFGCSWVTVASGNGDYRPGGGSGRRANARKTCASTANLVGWRGFVDVDLNGQADPSGYTYSTIKNLYCAPS